MINISNINNRKNKLILENNVKVKEIEYFNCKENPDFKSTEKCMRGWKSLHENEEMALNKATIVLESYMNSDDIKANKDRILSIFSEDIIPSIKNIKESKKVFNKISNRPWYSPISESLMYNIECDTLLNNQVKLNKKINLESRFLFHSINEKPNIEDIIDTINEVCNDIKNMKVPIAVKYNVALENIDYTINKVFHNEKPLDRQAVFEAVTNNFLLDNYENDYQFYYMNKALEENSMFEDMDFFNEGNKISKFRENGKDFAKKIIKEFLTLPNKTPEGVKNVIKKFYTKSESSILEGAPSMLLWIRHLVTFSTLALSIPLGALIIFTDNFIALQLKQKETSKMISKYESEIVKCNEKLNKITDDKKKEKMKLYIKELNNSLEKLKSYQDTILSDKEKNEMNKVDFDESVIDEDFLKQCYVIESLENKIVKFNELYNNDIIQEGIYTNCLLRPMNSVLECSAELVKYGILDKEQLLDSLNETRNNIRNNSIILEAGIFDNIMDNIKQRKIDKARKQIIQLTEDDINGFDKLLNFINSVIFNYFSIVYKIEGYAFFIIGVIPFSIAVLFDKCRNKLTKTKVKELYKIRKNLIKTKKMLEYKDKDVNKKYIQDLDESIKLIDEGLKAEKQIENAKSKEEKNKKEKFLKRKLNELLDENTYITLSEKIYDLDVLTNSIRNISNIQESKELESLEELDYINYIMECMIYDELGVVNEMQFKNKVKLGVNKGKHFVQKVKDKEKGISSNLDNAFETFMTNKKKSMENKTREQVVKGTVIPSASKVIKLALAGAITAAAIHPAITVVGVLGAIALNKRATKKERQYILDEIEIQKQIVDKKLQMADNNNDMKATEELLKLQKKLKKEEQRIKYKMSDRVIVVNSDRD